MLPGADRPVTSFSSSTPHGLSAGAVIGDGGGGDHPSLPGRKPKELYKMRNETTAEHRGGKEARLSPRLPNFIFVLGALAWNYIA